MGYWLVLGGCILFVLFFIFGIYRWDWEVELCAFPFGLALSVMLICVLTLIIAPISAGHDLNEFKVMKLYFETHNPDNDLEDVRLTEDKIKYNIWLADAQYREKNYPLWSFMPDEVLDLRPID